MDRQTDVFISKKLACSSTSFTIISCEKVPPILSIYRNMAKSSSSSSAMSRTDVGCHVLLQLPVPRAAQEVHGAGVGPFANTVKVG